MVFIGARMSVFGGRPLTTPRDQRCRLRPHALDAVVSSDLARAWTTGRIVAEGLGVPLIREPGLREANIGEAEGLFWPEVKSRFGETLTERWFTDDDAAFPGGETGLETRTRGLAALRRFVAAQPYRRIGVSTHGAMVRQLMKHALPPAVRPRRREIPCFTYCNIRQPPSASPSSPKNRSADRQRRAAGAMTLAPHASTGMSRFLHSRSAALDPSGVGPFCSQNAGPCLETVVHRERLLDPVGHRTIGLRE
jgi:probable phosphoglycerate mutase